MNEKHYNEFQGKTNLPSFVNFNSNSSRYSPLGCLSDGLFVDQGTDRKKTDFTKEEEDDTAAQYFLSSDSSISTPDIINSVYSNNSGSTNESLQRNIENHNNLWLKVDFLSPSSFFYKDVDKPSNAVKLSYLPKLDYPVLYVEKGRVIELTTETNFYPPANSVIKFDIFSRKGPKEEPVYGASNESISNQSGSNSNLCFIQATEEHKVSAYYLKSDDGFITMVIPINENPFSFSAVFPFLNFKCQTSSKKVVFLRISVCNGTIVFASKTFQLVCCTSPNRDYKRHYEKLNKDVGNKIPVKKTKTASLEGIGHNSSNTTGNQPTSAKDNPQYVIMTENYDIWKILHVVHQQLSVHFNSTKK